MKIFNRTTTSNYSSQSAISHESHCSSSLKRSLLSNPALLTDQNKSTNKPASTSTPSSLTDQSKPTNKPVSPPNPGSLTDQNLYALCKTYGSRALEWRRKFTGLLPEVFKRKLYEKKGFESIFVFAKKLAGLSEQQVRLALNLEKRFENLPLLLALLVSGEVSVNKLVRIASIVNLENEEFLASQVKILSSAAIETLVRDEKWAKNELATDSQRHSALALVFQNSTKSNQNANGLFQPTNEAKSLHMQRFLQSNFPESNYRITKQNPLANPSESNHQIQQSSRLLTNTQTGGESARTCIPIDMAQTCPPDRQAFPATNQSLNLSPEVHQKLLELQQKGLDLNQLLLEFLQKREIEIDQKKEEISRKVLQRENQKSKKLEEIGEYILENPLQKHRPSLPMPVKKILKEEYGIKCAILHCQKPAENIHHTLPFSINRSHDPKFLIPLCKEHHELQHAINSKYQKRRAIMANSA